MLRAGGVLEPLRAVLTETAVKVLIVADTEDTPTLPAIISRAEAKAAGLKRYFTGRPCKNGHVAEHEIGGQCVVCGREQARARYADENPSLRREKRQAEYLKYAERAKAYSARYREENPEKSKAALDRYRAENKEKIAAAAKARRDADPEKHRGTCRRWRAANRERIAEYNRARYEACPEKFREQSRRYAAANPEKVKARTRAWRLANPEKIRTLNAAWLAANRDRKRATTAAWREANREKLREKKKIYGAAYYALNRERIKAKGEAYRAANPGRDAAKNAAWRAANPGQVRMNKRLSEARRRARKRGAGGSHTAEDIQRIYDAQKGKCAYCREKVGRRYHVDHIHPLAKGGSNGAANLQIVCGPCNFQKRDRDPIEHAQKLGLLL